MEEIHIFKSTKSFSQLFQIKSNDTPVINGQNKLPEEIRSS